MWFFKCSFCLITHWDKKILSHCYTVSHQLLLCQMMSVLKLRTNVKYINSSNEVPLAFTLLWSISVCVKVFPKFLLKKEIRVDMKIKFSCRSQTVSYLPLDLCHLVPSEDFIHFSLVYRWVWRVPNPAFSSCHVHGKSSWELQLWKFF